MARPLPVLVVLVAAAALAVAWFVSRPARETARPVAPAAVETAAPASLVRAEGAPPAADPTDARAPVAGSAAHDPAPLAAPDARAEPEPVGRVRIRWQCAAPVAMDGLELVAGRVPVRDPAAARRFDVPDTAEGEREVELAAGTWIVSATASIAAALGKPVDVVADATVEVELTLRPGAPLAGIVVDAASGAPIAGASVDRDFSNGLDAVVTDAGGRFELACVPQDGGGGLRAFARGYGTELLRVRWDEASRGWRRMAVDRSTLGDVPWRERWRTAGPEDEDRSAGLVIALPPARTVRGVVLSPSSEPLDVSVFGYLESGMPGLFSPLRREHDPDPDQVALAADGRFEVTELHPEAGYEVTIAQAGMGTRAFRIEPGLEDVDLGTVHLAVAGSIRGRVAEGYAEVRGIELVRVHERKTLVPAGRWLDPHPVAPGGAFHFDGLAEGSYRLVVRGDGDILGTHEVTLRASEHFDTGVLEPQS